MDEIREIQLAIKALQSIVDGEVKSAMRSAGLISSVCRQLGQVEDSYLEHVDEMMALAVTES